MGLASNELYELLAILAACVLAVVFVADMIGNMIVFNNRFLNALVTGLVFLVLFGIVYYLYLTEFGTPGLVPIGAFLVFCADLVSNSLAFRSRIANALLTAFITIIALGSLTYYLLAS